MQDIKALADQVRQIAYAIHVYHAHGHLEKVYENALAHRLRKAGLNVQQQYPIKVHDEDGTLIGEYIADLLVEGVLIVELKTAKALAPEHEAHPWPGEPAEPVDAEDGGQVWGPWVMADAAPPLTPGQAETLRVLFGQQNTPRTAGGAGGA